jgi:hypothetical protein
MTYSNAKNTRRLLIWWAKPTRPKGFDPRLGERAVGRVAEGGRNCRGQDLSQGHQNGADMGRLHDGKVDLAHCEGLREQDRYGKTGPS